MNYSAIMTLSEASRGFASIENEKDYFPYLSLEESTSMLPTIIEECVLENYEITRKNNEFITESVVNAVYAGTDVDTKAIIEASTSSLKEKIKKIFTRIKNFIVSIINKIKLAINKNRMSGQALLSRYGNDKALQKNFKDFTFENGYEFKNDQPFAAIDKYCSGDGVVDLMRNIEGFDALESNILQYIPDMKSYDGDDEDVTDEEKAKIKDIISTVTDQTETEKKTKLISVITGIDVSGDSWRDEINKQLYGEKKPLKYGTDFTYEKVKTEIVSDNNFTSILNGYTKLLNAVETQKKDLEGSISTIENVKEKYNNAHGKAGEETKGLERFDMFISGMNAYIGLLTTAISAITTVQDIRRSYEEKRNSQFKAIFVKMYNYKAPKSNNSDASEFVDIEFDEL